MAVVPMVRGQGLVSSVTGIRRPAPVGVAVEEVAVWGAES